MLQVFLEVLHIDRVQGLRIDVVQQGFDIVGRDIIGQGLSALIQELGIHDQDPNADARDFVLTMGQAVEQLAVDRELHDSDVSRPRLRRNGDRYVGEINGQAAFEARQSVWSWSA